MPPPPSSASLFEPAHRPLVQAAVQIAFANPFRGESGDACRIAAELGPVIDGARDRLAEGCRASQADRALYEVGCLFLLHRRYDERFQPYLDGIVREVGFYDDFVRDYDRLFPRSVPAPLAPAHLFACFFQLRRAFFYVSSTLIGASAPVVRLRVSAWEAIFTHDVRRYMRSLHERMASISLLVTGPTGTGKELVARAVGLSCYVPFDAERRRFAHAHDVGYQALNLSAMSPALIESELFGHARGSFTGATGDHEGWLDRCGHGGCLFIDEIGDLHPDIQVKLLRVVQLRTYHRIGETKERRFLGKIIVATWRDLPALVRSGKFREDLYYRLRGNRIVTPPLRAILAAHPDDRRTLVRHITAEVAGPGEVDSVTEKVEAFIDARLARYAWPGNVRELEVCVKNVMVFGEYDPDEISPKTRTDIPPKTATEIPPEAEIPPETRDESPPETGDDPVFDRDAREGTLNFAVMGDRYITHVRWKAGSNHKAARLLAIDVRTVRARIDHALLARLTAKTAKGDEDDEDD